GRHRHISSQYRCRDEEGRAARYRARGIFVRGYLGLDAAPFDVIISDSVVQNIPNTPCLLRRLACMLKPGALLLVTIPYDGIYNRLLWTLRRIARLLAGPWLEHVLLRIAQRLHPDW